MDIIIEEGKIIAKQDLTMLPDSTGRQDDAGEGIQIDAFHLTSVSKNNIVLLNDISLSIPPGALVGLVGSSGAGKSTLMNALSGFRFAQRGNVLYNQLELYQHTSCLREQIGCVPQDTIVHYNLTVDQALYYTAKMRLPVTHTNRHIRKRINEVLVAVGLVERRNVLISKLSGGQRKRVSIALELLEKPAVFFLDEPTSGLDAGLDYKMMHLMRRLADKGQAVIIATHSITHINLCDYVCFLAPGGRLAYFGPPEEALAYFGVSEFAAIYTLLEPDEHHRQNPQEAESRFKASEDYQRYVLDPLSKPKGDIEQRARRYVKKRTSRRCGAWRQFWLLSARYLKLLKHDTGNMLLLLFQAPVIALLLLVLVKYEVGINVLQNDHLVKCPVGTSVFTATGLPNIPAQGASFETVDCQHVQHILRYDGQGKAYATKRGGVDKALQDFIAPGSGTDAQKILFITSFSSFLFGCVNAVREFVKERSIYQRERTLYLNIFPYMFSKIAVLGLLCLLQVAILVLALSVVLPFSRPGILTFQILEVYITLVLTSLAGLMTGLAISALAPTVDRAVSFIPLLLIPQIIFSGTVFPMKGELSQFLATLVAVRWSIGALGSIIGLHSDKLGEDTLIGTMSTYCGRLFSTCTATEASSHLLYLWAALALMICLLAGLVGLFLRFVTRPHSF
ncbi:hypothetical protein KDA_04370 [Dictyobacter alpinus]|uniref:ABC transporter domain-containing protein n=1 Tax=Dictyobacter alpinus TaxID=2014873 RepID=A0A402B0T0_9CHLR|nr:ATP-binding cassette domain-containing protein [Dictyobacter alpinus]GCE24953.1 hypothetical protein KDA_04370 [Dictyobacter alpinus]